MLQVRCKAKPQPTVEWFKDGKKLEAVKRLVIKEHKVTAEMFEYSCIVKVRNPLSFALLWGSPIDGRKLLTAAEL